MGMIRSLRLMHGLLDGTINAAALETLLTSGGRSGDFLQLMTIPTYTSLLSNSLPAAQAIIASAAPSAKAKEIFVSLPSAVSIFLASPIAGPEMVKTSSALSALLALPTFAAKIIASGLFASVIGKNAALTTAFLNIDSARRAVWDSDVALAVIRDEPNALAGARAASGHNIVSQSTTTTYATATNVNAVARRILLSYTSDYGGSCNLLTSNARRADSTLPENAALANTNPSTGGLLTINVLPWLSLSSNGTPGRMANNATNLYFYISNLPVTA